MVSVQGLVPEDRTSEAAVFLDAGDYDDSLGTQTTDIVTAGVLAVIRSARF